MKRDLIRNRTIRIPNMRTPIGDKQRHAIDAAKDKCHALDMTNKARNHAWPNHVLWRRAAKKQPGQRAGGVITQALAPGAIIARAATKPLAGIRYNSQAPNATSATRPQARQQQMGRWAAGHRHMDG